MITVKDIPYNPKMPIITGAISILYDLPGCSCGGACHIVTDDDNIEDHDLQFIIDDCTTGEDKDRPEAELCVLICKLMLQLTIHQRIALFASYVRFDMADCINEDMWKIYIEDVLRLEELPNDINDLY